MTSEGVTRKVVSSVYSKKKSTATAPSTKDERITDANFGQRLFQALRPPPSESLLTSKQSSEGEEEQGGGVKRPCSVRNLHELLQTGSSSRLLDELEYLLSGLKGAIEGKRDINGYLIDISKRLLNDRTPAKVSSLRASGAVEKVMGTLVGGLRVDKYSAPLSAFISVLLHQLCSEVRRIDHFVPLGELDFIIETILSVGDGVTILELLDLQSSMSRFIAPLSNVWELTLWLMAKICVAIQTMGSGVVEFDGMDRFHSDAAIKLLSSSISLPVDDPSSSRALFVAGFLASNVAQGQKYPLVFGKLFSLIMDSDGCREDHLKVLITLTGDNVGSRWVSDESAIVTKLIRMLGDQLGTTLPVGAHLILISSILINLVDRDKGVRRAVVDRVGLVSSAIEFLKTEDEQLSTARAYLGVLFGISLADDNLESEQIKSQIRQHGIVLSDCFTSLIDYLGATSQLTDTIHSQLDFFRSAVS